MISCVLNCPAVAPGVHGSMIRYVEIVEGDFGGWGGEGGRGCRRGGGTRAYTPADLFGGPMRKRREESREAGWLEPCVTTTTALGRGPRPLLGQKSHLYAAVL